MIPRPTFEEEEKLWESGVRYVFGLDEVGRGAFAGPLVAAGVVFAPFSETSADINDSKLLSPQRREQLEKIIKKQALMHTYSEIPVSFINQYGVGKANQIAFQQIVKTLLAKLGRKDIFVLVDGFSVPELGVDIHQQKAIIKGDQKSISIAAASILAKVYRDRLMTNLGVTFAKYDFGKNKGYGTLFHREALKLHGLSSQHRRVFCQKCLAVTK